MTSDQVVSEHVLRVSTSKWAWYRIPVIICYQSDTRYCCIPSSNHCMYTHAHTRVVLYNAHTGTSILEGHTNTLKDKRCFGFGPEMISMPPLAALAGKSGVSIWSQGIICVIVCVRAQESHKPRSPSFKMDYSARIAYEARKRRGVEKENKSQSFTKTRVELAMNQRPIDVRVHWLSNHCLFCWNQTGYQPLLIDLTGILTHSHTLTHLCLIAFSSVPSHRINTADAGCYARWP